MESYGLVKIKEEMLRSVGALIHILYSCVWYFLQKLQGKLDSVPKIFAYIIA